MNIIRTKAVELSTIQAIAYKQKLASGGAGVKLIRLDQDATAVATIDKRTGEAVPYGAVDDKLFPYEAFSEAIELLNGMPYAARGKIALQRAEVVDVIDVVEGDDEEKIDMVDSEEYAAIVERYSDEKGKLNYRLMNKDFIQFASKSKTVAEMVAAGADVEDILLFIIKSRATYIAGKKESLDDVYVAALMETLDEIDPRGAFKELRAHLIRMLR